MSVLSDWQSAKTCNFKLHGEVHVWRISFSQLSENNARLRALLSPEEIHRADKFHFKKDRVGFVASHAYLRFLLSRYLQVTPHSLLFFEGEHGKPYLKNFGIQFNISHSNLIGLLAFDSSLPLGVDIEWIRADFGGLKIARRFFSAAEVRELSTLEGKEQIEGFFNGWSRKEAYIKALGMGLSLSLNKFSVSLTPGVQPRLIETAHDPQALKLWRLEALDASPGYKAALVVSKRRKIIRLFEVDQI